MTQLSAQLVDVKMSRNRFLSLLFLWCHDWCTAKLLELTVTVSLQSKAICQVQIQNSLHCIPIQIQVKSHLPNSNSKQLSLPAFHFKFKSKAICHSCLFPTQYQLPVSTLTGSLHQPPCKAHGRKELLNCFCKILNLKSNDGLLCSSPHLIMFETLGMQFVLVLDLSHNAKAQFQQSATTSSIDL